MTLQEQLRKLTTGGPGVTHIASETLFEDCAQKLDDDWKDHQALMKLLADEKHKVAALEARCRELEAAIDGASHTAEWKSNSGYAHILLAARFAKETFGEHGWTCASAKHLDMVTGNTGTMCRVCGEPHYSLETGTKP